MPAPKSPSRTGNGLSRRFALAELGPPEDRQAKRYRGRVEHIDVPVQFEDVVYPLLAGLIHHVEGEVLEDPIVPVLVGPCQGCLGHGLGAHSHVIALRLVGFQGNNQVSEAFSAAELSEHHDEQLVPAGEVLHILVASLFAD